MSYVLGITTHSQIAGDSYLLFFDSRLSPEHKLCQSAQVNFTQITAELSYMAHSLFHNNCGGI